MLVVTAAEMRQLDRLTIEKYGTPGYTLMQRAGRGAAQALLGAMSGAARRGVVVCAGRGNNGGDGFVVARELKRRGVRAEVFLLAATGDVRGDAARALAAYARARGKMHSCRNQTGLGALQAALRRAGVVVDAIFGTGLKGAVRGLAADAIELMNASGTPVFAVDIPSGLDSDRGVPLGCAVQAEATATFGFAKLGQVLYPGVEHVGRLAIVDIGIPVEAVVEVAPQCSLLDEPAMSRLVPRRAPVAHKGDCGHVLVLAGSRGKTGAAKLAALGAMRAGAGLVTVAVPDSQQPVVAGGLLEAMTEPMPDTEGRIAFDARALRHVVDGKRAVVFGPGVGTHEGARRTLRWLLEEVSAPLVIDADGLTCAAAEIGRLGCARGPVVLTPHPGEMSRLRGASTAAVQADRVGVARELAAAQRCTVVLKGARTVIAEVGGAVAINPTGNAGMASGGMGDVLAGVIGGLLAQGLSPGEAARLGVFVHGLAGDMSVEAGGPLGLLASDVGAALPAALRALREEGPQG